MKIRGGATLIQDSEYYRIDLDIVREFAEYGLYPTMIVDGEIGIEAVLGPRERIAGLEAEIEAMAAELLALKRRSGSDETEALERLGLLIEVDALPSPS